MQIFSTRIFITNDKIDEGIKELKEKGTKEKEEKRTSIKFKIEGLRFKI